MIRVPVTFAFLILTMVATSTAQTISVRLPASTPSTTPPNIQPARASDVDQSVNLTEVRELARKTRAALRDNVLRGALDPAITGRNSAPVQAVSLEVGKDGEAVGKAKLSWRLDDYDSAVDMILRGPLNQSSGVPITDRGLASGASVTLGYNLTLWGSTVSPVAASVTQTSVSSPSASLSPIEALVATGMAIQAAASSAPDGIYADHTMQALNQLGTRSAFESRNPRQIAHALREAGAARLNRTLSLRGSYGVGSTTFKFAELADPLVEVTDTKTDTSTSLSAAYVQLLRDGSAEAPLMLISGGFARTNGWRGGRARQLCTPIGATSALECRSLVIGAPTEQTVNSYEVDIRSWAYSQKLGINPHFSYDKSTRKWTSEIGLSYLVLKDALTENALPQLDPKAITVGLRVGSRPEEDGGVYAAIFFGSVLSR